MGELTSALDALAAEDLKPMFGPQLLDRAAELLRARNRIEAELTRTVRECELTQAAEHDGQKTMQSWLRGHGRLSSGAASRVVHSGRALEHLPAVAAAFAAGEVTADQVAVIAPIAAPDKLAAAQQQGVDLPAMEDDLAAVAAEHPHDKLQDVVKAYLAALDPDGPEPDPTDGRRLSIARHADGSITGRFDLDPVGGEKEKDHPLPTTRKLAAGPWGWPYAPSSWQTPSCSWPTTPSRRAACRSCAPSSRT